MSDSVPASPTQSCLRCGRPTGAQFSGSGLCPACAAATLLDQTQSGRSSLSPFADTVSGPEHVGPYQIIERLGAGGMGSVYLAQHRQLGRVVALKVIPIHGGGGRELRFQREAQTVASLRHPHIVSVHDAGADARHFYFAMDYVEGGDLAARLRRTPFAPRDAATLLHKIAEAVAYSHAQGVLHRDLKPSNILLEGDEPRVADFGLATPLESGGDLTPHTSVLGTPHYLAPEALLKGSAAQSPASDVYSLGVILYELLCARLPFAASTPVELQQLIATTEPLAPHLLAPRVPRDLETICLKALATEPARRYATAAELAEDLRRFLAGETILARPAAPVERLVRWARRRPSLAASWVLLFVLAAGSTVAAWRINRERRAAETEAARSRALFDFVSEDLLGSALKDQDADPDVKLRTLVDRTAKKLPERFAARPEIEHPLSEMLGEVYHRLGDFKAAQKHLQRALELSRAHYAPGDMRTLTPMRSLGAVMIGLGDTAGARAQFTEARVQSAKFFGENAAFTINLDADLGRILIAEGKLPEARQLLESTLNRARTLGVNRDVAMTIILINLGGVYGRMEKYPECIAALEEAIQVEANAGRPNSLDALVAKQSLGVAYLGTFRYADSERLLTEVAAARRKMLGPEHPRTLITIGSLIRAQLGQGHYAEALTGAEELLAVRQRVLAPGHPDIARTQELIGYIHLDAERPDAALPWLQQTYEARMSKPGGTIHPDTLNTRRLLAYAHFSRGKFKEAQALIEPMTVNPGKIATDSWQFGIQNLMLGAIYLEDGAFTKAASLLRTGQEIVAEKRAQIPPIWLKLTEKTPEYLAKLRSVPTN